MMELGCGNQVLGVRGAKTTIERVREFGVLLFLFVALIRCEFRNFVRHIKRVRGGSLMSHQVLIIYQLWI